MKKLISLTFVLLIVTGILLSGCSNSGNTEKASKGESGGGDSGSGSSGKKVTITLWNHISDHLFDDATKGFESKHPNIHVKIVQMPDGSAGTAQYQAAVAHNELADIFIPEKYTLPQFVKLGQLHKLDEVFTPKVKELYTQGTWYAGNTTLNGHVYSFPIYSSVGGAYLLFYNKKVLQKYGIKSIPKTWDDVLAVGKEIYKKSSGKIYGVMMGAKADYIGSGAALSIAKSLSPETGFNFKTGKYNYATDGMVQTFHFFKKLRDQKVLDPESLTLNDNEIIPIFTTGKAAFLISGNWAGGIMLAKSGFKDFGVTYLPTKSANDRHPFKNLTGGGQGLYVAKYTKHWPQVKLYLQYLAKHLYANVVKEGRQVPAKKLSNIPGDVKSQTPGYRHLVELMKNSKIQVPNPVQRNTEAWKVDAKYNSIKPHKNVGGILRGYLSGQVPDPKAALEQLTEGDNEAFKKALQANDKVSIKDYTFPNWVAGKPYAE